MYENKDEDKDRNEDNDKFTIAHGYIILSYYIFRQVVALFPNATNTTLDTPIYCALLHRLHPLHPLHPSYEIYFE